MRELDGELRRLVAARSSDVEEEVVARALVERVAVELQAVRDRRRVARSGIVAPLGGADQPRGSPGRRRAGSSAACAAPRARAAYARQGCGRRGRLPVRGRRTCDRGRGRTRRRAGRRSARGRPRRTHRRSLPPRAQAVETRSGPTTVSPRRRRASPRGPVTAAPARASTTSSVPPCRAAAPGSTAARSARLSPPLSAGGRSNYPTDHRDPERRGDDARRVEPAAARHDAVHGDDVGDSSKAWRMPSPAVPALATTWGEPSAASSSLRTWRTRPSSTMSTRMSFMTPRSNLGQSCPTRERVNIRVQRR